MGIGGIYLTIVKAMNNNPITNIILNVENLKASPQDQDQDKGALFTIIIQHSSRSLSYRNQRRKRNKRNPDWKRRSKTLTVCR